MHTTRYSAKRNLSITDLVAALKQMVPSKEEALNSKLQKYAAGRLPATAAYKMLQLDVGNEAIVQAFTKLAPGFHECMVYPNGTPHPIVV